MLVALFAFFVCAYYDVPWYIWIIGFVCVAYDNA